VTDILQREMIKFIVQHFDKDMIRYDNKHLSWVHTERVQVRVAVSTGFSKHVFVCMYSNCNRSQ